MSLSLTPSSDSTSRRRRTVEAQVIIMETAMTNSRTPNNLMQHTHALRLHITPHVLQQSACLHKHVRADMSVKTAGKRYKAREPSEQRMRWRRINWSTTTG
ncbi:hypothetical protein AMECASPLE_020918, partial [Ameca splendens]